MSTDKNKHLGDSLTSHRTSKEQGLLDKHTTKRDEVVTALEEKYGADLLGTFMSGSFAKNCAVNLKFDFDLVAPFKRSAFDTLKAMFEDVYEFLKEKYQYKAIVRKQKVSIGLEFLADEDGDVVKIDVVPGRELNKDQYKEDNKLNLYVYDQFGSIAGGSDRIQTNIRAQINNIKDRATKEKDSIRKVIRLLKIWKLHNGKKPKSFFLELITIKAFDSKTISGDLWTILETVLAYIRDEVKTVTLPDPGNSNNEVADTLSDFDKSALSDDMKYMLERINEDSDYIKTYFPINDKFPPDDDKRYAGSLTGLSVPPPKRFA